MTTNQPRKLITLLTGGGGFDEGAKMAGFTPVLGVEIVPEIAHWAEVNTPGLTVIRSDVAAVDYSQFETPYHLHASPSCKNASNANGNGEEAQEDLGAAQGVCNALIALHPPVFTLENVYQYREYQSFKLILKALHNLGYAFNYWHLNAADYGVPQSRKRLILIARKDRKPTKPAATHTDPASLNGQMGMFGQPQLKPWVGWYKAIADIVDSLPDSEFADWQLKRLPKEFGSFVIDSNVSATVSKASDPITTITTENGRRVRAFFVPGDNTSNTTVREADEPMVTVQSRSTGQCPHRAFLVNKSADKYGDGVAYDNEPSFSIVTTSQGRYKAWLPQGRVVKMIPRALARFQSVPDNYLLPDDDKLACTIIGNMVPPLLAKAICESVKE